MKTKKFDFYEPIIINLDKEPAIPSYYELRVWENHKIISQLSFKTLKEARKYYKNKDYEYYEGKGLMYVEITKIKQLK